MNALSLVIPLLFLGVFLYAAFKKVKLYDSFARGIAEVLPLLHSLFPYLAAIFLLTQLMEASGLSQAITSLLSPLFSCLGVPPEIVKLLLVKPFSGSGATALLSDLLATYGPDSYIARCACVSYGSSETVFYISAVYFAKAEHKSLALPIFLSLLASFLAALFGCLICRFL